MKWTHVVAPTALCLVVGYAALAGQPEGLFRPEIPRVWRAAALEQLEVPVSNPAYSPMAVSEEYYYRIPTAVIYESYPVYAPGSGPAGYLDKLKHLAPEVAFDPARLKSKQDWIRAGETVFDAATEYGTAVTLDDVSNPEWCTATGVPVAKDRSITWIRYVVRGTGKVEVGVLSCGFCHTRVLPDGSVQKGAQSNFSFDKDPSNTAGRWRPGKAGSIQRVSGKTTSQPVSRVLASRLAPCQGMRSG